jgi:hypothetical protein
VADDLVFVILKNGPVTFPTFFVTLIECQIHLKITFMQSFQERAKLGMEKLSKQLPTTLEKAREQAQRLKDQSSTKSKKSRN